jgi:hypothetical protein
MMDDENSSSQNYDDDDDEDDEEDEEEEENDEESERDVNMNNNANVNNQSRDENEELEDNKCNVGIKKEATVKNESGHETTNVGHNHESSDSSPAESKQMLEMERKSALNAAETEQRQHEDHQNVTAQQSGSSLYMIPEPVSYHPMHHHNEFLHHSKENIPRPGLDSYGPATGQFSMGALEQQGSWPFYPSTSAHHRIPSLAYSSDALKHQQYQAAMQQQQQHQPVMNYQQTQPYGPSSNSSFYNFNMTPLSASSPSSSLAVAAAAAATTTAKFSQMNNGGCSDFNSYAYQQQQQQHSYMTTPSSVYTSYAAENNSFYAAQPLPTPAMWNMNV